MLHLLHLFEVQENDSGNGLPEGVTDTPNAILVYRGLLQAFLDGSEHLRVLDDHLDFFSPARRRPAHEMHVSVGELIDAIRAHDSLVADMLVRIETDSARGDTATYAIVYPPGVTLGTLWALAKEIRAASKSCGRLPMPGDCDRAWRRVLSDAASAHGIDFSATL